MIVDDEPDVAFTIEFSIKDDEKYEIVKAKNGKNCLNLLENESLPDLVLLDIMLPDMSGLDVYKKIKENPMWKSIPVIFLTARICDEDNTLEKCLGDDYIEKPYAPEDLKRRIEKILNKN